MSAYEGQAGYQPFEQPDESGNIITQRVQKDRSGHHGTGAAWRAAAQRFGFFFPEGSGAGGFSAFKVVSPVSVR